MTACTFTLGFADAARNTSNSKTTEAINAQLCRRGSQTVSLSGVYTTITSSHCPQLTQSTPGRRQLRATLGRSALRKCWEFYSDNVEERLFTGVRRKRHQQQLRHVGHGRIAIPAQGSNDESGRRTTLRSARKHNPTNCMPMFIEKTCPNTLVEEVTFRASSATCERLRNNVLISVCKQRGHNLQLKHLLCTPANSR